MTIKTESDKDKELLERWYLDEIEGRDPRFNPVGIVILFAVIVFLCASIYLFLL